MSQDPYAFEIPIQDLKARIAGLQSQPPTAKTDREIEKLKQKLKKVKRDIFSGLSDWQRCLVARHPKRPYAFNYIEALCSEFEEFRGDRRFADDPAIIAGFGTFEGETVCFVAHQKGRNLKQKLYRNFGMPRPEGYRKALRIMKLAEKFKRPVVCLVDTPGAYPGIDAEERGQAEAIAFNLKEMATLNTPILVYIIGEGGSGGALALGIGDHICVLGNGIYSVISPEGCASILWKDASQMTLAANALNLTATKLKALGLIDSICEEPLGGAHDDPEAMYTLLADHLRDNLAVQKQLDDNQRLDARYRKFRNMGIYAQVG